MFSILTARRVPGLRLAEVALSLAVLSVVGCDKMPLLAPALSTISLSADTSIVQTNGVAEIRATVLESSRTPVQNRHDGDLLDQPRHPFPTRIADPQWVASVQFVANGQSGIADIRAASGGPATGSTANPSLKAHRRRCGGGPDRCGRESSPAAGLREPASSQRPSSTLTNPLSGVGFVFDDGRFAGSSFSTTNKQWSGADDADHEPRGYRHGGRAPLQAAPELLR